MPDGLLLLAAGLLLALLPGYLAREFDRWIGYLLPKRELSAKDMQWAKLGNRLLGLSLMLFGGYMLLTSLTS